MGVPFNSALNPFPRTVFLTRSSVGLDRALSNEKAPGVLAPGLPEARVEPLTNALKRMLAKEPTLGSINAHDSLDQSPFWLGRHCGFIVPVACAWSMGCLGRSEILPSTVWEMLPMTDVFRW